MIEAVNAALSTASSVRATAEQVTVAESLSANPARIQKASIAAAYLSPHVRLRPDMKPIFVVRDSNTGEAIRQFPTEAQIRAYQRAKEMEADVDVDVDVADIPGEQAEVSPEEIADLMENSIQYKEVRAEPAPDSGESEGFSAEA